MSRTYVGLALGLLLGLLEPHALRAEEPPDLGTLALEGRWADARDAWRRWREPLPLGRLDLSGYEVELWRPTWTVDGQGRATAHEDDHAAELRSGTHRYVAKGATLPSGSPGAFPALEALYAERLLREVRGMGDLPTGSPLASLPDPAGTIARFLVWQRHVYQPVPPEQSPDAAWAAQAKAAREKAETHRSQAHRAALLAAGLLLGLTLLLGWRLGRPPRP